MLIEFKEENFMFGGKYLYWKSGNKHIEISIFPVDREKTRGHGYFYKNLPERAGGKFYMRVSWHPEGDCLDEYESVFYTSVEKYYPTLEDAKSNVLFLLSELSQRSLKTLKLREEDLLAARESQQNLSDFITALGEEYRTIPTITTTL